MLTAGHRGALGEQFNHDGKRVAGMLRRQQEGSADAGLLAPLDDHFRTSNLVYYQEQARSARVTSGQLYAQAYVGQFVCRTGARTGDNCGYVQHINVAPSYVFGSSRFILADYCSQPGDSGGSVLIAETALGVHSGGSTYDCPDERDYGVYGHIELQEQAVGAAVRTRAP